MKRILSLALAGMLTLSMWSGVALAETDTTKTAETTTTVEATEVVPAQESNVIDILSVNDFHGNVKESGKNIGMAKMVTYINDQKAANPNTLVVAAGDSYQGTAISNLTFGAPVNEMYKAMGVIASAVGNHEFDWGVEQIKTWGQENDFPFLAANIYDKNTNEPVAWAKPYMIQEVAGKKIAFLGLSTIQTAYQTKLENVATLEFKTAEDAAKIWVEYLKAGKAEEGTPDLIVALTHVPSSQDAYGSDPTLPVKGEEIEALATVEGLDAIITGHSHRTVAGYINGVPVVQAYKNGRSVGKISIELNEDGSVKAITPSVTAVYKISSDLVEDADVKAGLTKLEEEYAPVFAEVVGELKGTLSHDRSAKNVTVLGYWSSDVMRKATGVQIGIQNGGGLRTTLEEGPITMEDMYLVMPYDNQLVTMEVTGAHLKKLIDHGIEADFMTDGQYAGVIVEYDPSREYEDRITKITLEDGTPIDMEATYTIVTNDFINGGGDKYDFSGATNVVDTFVPIRNVLVDAFKNGPVVAPEVDVISTVEYEVYVIQANDVLWKIAEAYGLTFETLAEMNELDNPHLIFEGATLKVPAK